MNNLPNYPDLQPQTSATEDTTNTATTNENQSLSNTINSQQYIGSMQSVLLNNLGAYVIVDFLIGSNNLITREGILYSVGISYLVLFEEKNDQYTICDLYAVKFVTYVSPQNRPVRPTMNRNLRL